MIRSELDVLLDKVEEDALRADLRSQIDQLKQRRSFGLVFEQHIPERVRLPQHPIRVGSQVVSRDDDDSPTFEIIALGGDVATISKIRESDGSYLRHGGHAAGGQEQAPLDSLVVISDFGERVLPGFRHVGSIERGGDKPYHVVINGENHHVLELAEHMATHAALCVIPYEMSDITAWIERTDAKGLVEGFDPPARRALPAEIEEELRHVVGFGGHNGFLGGGEKEVAIRAFHRINSVAGAPSREALEDYLRATGEVNADGVYRAGKWYEEVRDGKRHRDYRGEIIR